MRGSDGAVHPVFGLTSFALGVLLVLFAQVMAMPAHAQNGEYIPRGQPVPQNIRWTGSTAAGATTRASATWSGAYGTTHHNFPVPVSSSTLGGAARAAVRRGLPIVGWGMVLKDIINGAGWVIDELGQQITTPGQQAEPLGTTVWCVQRSAVQGGGSGRSCVSAASHIPQAVSSLWGGLGVSPDGAAFANGYHYQIRILKDGKAFGSVLFARVTNYTPVAGENGNPSSPPVPISDYDLGNALKHSPQVVNAVLIDPDTGAPLRTPELIAALNGLRQALEAANGVTNPGPDLVPDEGWADKPTPSQTEWPEFCNWAATVCDFIGWVKTEPDAREEPEIEWEEEAPETLQWSSGLGGGSCPSPVVFSVSLAGTTASPEFSFSALCEFGTMMRPVVIVLATIVAGFILAGQRGSKDA